jgi:hypothetical protein
MKQSTLLETEWPLRTGRAPSGSDTVLNDEALILQHQSRKSLVTSQRHL